MDVKGLNILQPQLNFLARLDLEAVQLIRTPLLAIQLAEATDKIICNLCVRQTLNNKHGRFVTFWLRKQHYKS